jgi:hypothetical protein
MKYEKNSAGHYVIKGKTYELLVGSRAQVMHGTAYKTTGELTKEAFLQNKHGRIVSKSKYNTGKNKNKNNLLLHGYTAKKGKFGYVKVGSRSRGHGRKHRGGTTDPTNSGTPEPANGVNQGTAPGSGASPANIPAGGVAAYETSSLALNAAPFSGGRRRRSSKRHPHGGAFLGGKRRRTHRRRRGGSMPALTPADF